MLFTLHSLNILCLRLFSLFIDTIALYACPSDKFDIFPEICGNSENRADIPSPL